MRPEILLYSSLLLALPADLLIRLRNKNLLALRAAFQAHPVHDNHRCDYIERLEENQDFILSKVFFAIFWIFSHLPLPDTRHSLAKKQGEPMLQIKDFMQETY